MNPTTTTQPAKQEPFPIVDLLPGELFRVEGSDRMIRLVRIDETEGGYVRVTIGALANSQNDRTALFSPSTRVVTAWP